MNFNQNITVYPSDEWGWDRIHQGLKYRHRDSTDKEIDKMIDSRRTENGGYKIAFWYFIECHNGMFYFATPMFKTFDFKLE